MVIGMKILPRASNQVIVESAEQGDFLVWDLSPDSIQVEATDRQPFRIQITTSDYKKKIFEVIRINLGKRPEFYP